MNGENLTAKTLLGNFQVIIPETPLLSQQAVTSKGISSTLPTYSWTLYPNTQLDLFYSDSFLFWCTAPKYVTKQSDVRIPVRDLLLCTNPSMWLTP